MTHPAAERITLCDLDAPTSELLRLSAIITAGSEPAVRDAIARANSAVPPVWVEELLLQCHLFAGFPRALNAMREWRRASGRPAPQDDTDQESMATWRARGEHTCALVYGGMYERLRMNVRALHPALDDWMIVDGYGKVLSRPGLDLPRRELCIVAACAASGQERQLQSHLHGALNVGVAPDVVGAAIEAVASVIDMDRLRTARMLWARLRGK
jgi:4-carboxymuconolactone decarboxylase